MLQIDPRKRPTIYEILRYSIIKDKIKLITEEDIIGTEKAELIKQQLLGLATKLE